MRVPRYLLNGDRVKTLMPRSRIALNLAACMAAVALVTSALVGISTWAASPINAAAATDRELFSGYPAVTVIPPAPGPAQTPPMGWNGFNRFYTTVNASIAEAEARALVASGMQAAGYMYVNLDGGWALRQRNASGALQPDPGKFPQGIRPVADFVHSLGLKFGIYASAGMTNCAGTSAGSYGHYQQDAATFASWGVDYLKLDWCFVPYRSFPQLTHRQLSVALASQMGRALAATGRPIVYDINNWTDASWSWAPGLGNMWRTSSDIQDHYASMFWNFSQTVNHSGSARPGAWNDPDMLEIGNGGMSFTEYQAEFALWAEMAAPLIAGNDLTTMSAATRSLLTNRAVIAIDQDPLGRQGYPVASAGGHWVLTKPLANGDWAVVLFNQTNTPATISAVGTQVGLSSGSDYTVVNVWTGSIVIPAITGTSILISATVAPHGVVMYRISRELEGPLVAERLLAQGGTD
jgi:alpha-galactosidase